MALNFSKIVKSVSQASQAVSSVNSITRAAIPSALPGKVGEVTQASLNIRAAVGDLSNGLPNNAQNLISKGVGSLDAASAFSQAKSFAQRGQLDVFSPGKLDSLVSSPGQAGNVAAAAGLIADSIAGVSQRGSIDFNSELSAGFGKAQSLSQSALGDLASVSGTLSKVSGQFGSDVTSIQSKVSVLSGFDIAGLNTLVGSFGDFSSLVKNVVTVIPKDIGEIVGAVGGEFDRLRQLATEFASTTPFDNFLNLNYSTPWDPALVSGSGVTSPSNSGKAASKLPNPLREAISWNYIITLGILDDNEFNFPSSYRNGDFTKKYILKSAGGNLTKRYKTYLEGDEDAEYYIENLELDAVIAPNRRTNVSLGTTLSFEVVEPYSMGQFIEAIIGISAETGYANYTDAPFCLKIDFVGWDEYGTAAGSFTQPIYIPILITKIDFTVTGKGAVYTVNAVPMSETGLDDKIQESKATINAVGQKVHEILNGDEKSVQAVFNERVQELEQAGSVIAEDRYIIAFPKTPDALVNVVNAGSAVGGGSLTIDAPEQQRREKGIASPETDRSTEIKQEGIEDNSVQSSSQLFNTIKAFASDTGSMNDIGLSDLVIDTTAPGDQPQAENEASYQDELDIVDIASSEAKPAEKGRSYQFEQGKKIEDIITSVLLDSEYCKERATEESENGTRKWFKIDTQVFIDKNPSATAQRGRAPKIYVYSVLPYYTDEAKFLGATQSPKNTQGLKDLAPKEYNYFYTGKNEDVLNFDITFNNAFFLSAFANYGQNSATTALDGANRTTLQNTDTIRGSEVEVEGGAKREPGAQISETNAFRHNGNGVGGDIKQRIAVQFHNTLINSPADMVTAEMEIWGDPFFLPQQTGNFLGTATDNPNVLAEQTMNYAQNEVFCVVNFKTPFDYQVEGATMEFPQNVPQFSGLYSIWAVTNTFSNGQFRQLLKMIRRRGQDDEPSGGSNPITPSEEKNIKETTDETLGASGSGSGAAANNSVNSTSGASDPCQTTEPVDLAGAVAALSRVPTTQEDQALIAMGIFNDKSTTAGDDVVFSQPVVQVGDFAWTPNQNVFGSAPKSSKMSDDFSGGETVSVGPIGLAAQRRAEQRNQAEDKIVVQNRPSGPGGNGGV